MTLGDHESAQKAYYQILEKGRIQKDSSLIVQSLYSLGQLYSDENDYKSAIKSFLELVELRKIYKLRPSTYSLIDYELSEAYVASNQLVEAEKTIVSGLQFLKEQKIDRLKPDFLLLQGQIALEQEQIDEAEKIYQKNKLLIQDSNDPFTLNASLVFQAQLLTHQKKYTKALTTYETLLAKVDTNDLNFISSIYENAQTTLFEMGNTDKAYQYLLKKEETVKKLKDKKKLQKTAYLQVKFESEQKEKENQELALEVLKEQSRSRYSYFITTFFLMGLLILFGAFYQKKKFNQTLQTEVKNRTQELEQSNKELEKFAYMASHDLKQPLSTIINFSNLLNKEIATSQNKESKIHLEYILDNGKRMMNLIENVLEYSILDKKNQELEIVDLNELVAEIKIMIAAYLTEKNALIKITTPLPAIKYDKTRMLIVFKNIIENGIKYNASENPTIIISNQKETDCIKISFQDNGIGIDEKYHHKLFQMFSRLQNHQDYEGSGLGLSTCKKNINNMGGNIGIEHNTNQGSLFYFTIPISYVALLSS